MALKRVASCFVMFFMVVSVLVLSSCGSDDDPPPSFVTSMGYYFENMGSDYFSDGANCAMVVYAYYSDIADADIESLVVTAPTGGGWTVPASYVWSGTSSSGKRYLSCSLVYSPNNRSFPLAGTWTAAIKLKNGKISSVRRTVHEPGLSIDATHRYLYTPEDWTPSPGQSSDYVAALRRLPTSGYSLRYSSSGGGSITTTGFAATRSTYRLLETRTYNFYCWLFDADENYLGMTVPEYSFTDHSKTALVATNGELQITGTTTTSTINLSAVKYVRLVSLDGSQFVPTSYGTYDHRSISSLVPVN